MKVFTGTFSLLIIAIAFLSVVNSFKSVSVVNLSSDISVICKTLCGANGELKQINRSPTGK